MRAIPNRAAALAASVALAAVVAAAAAAQEAPVVRTAPAAAHEAPAALHEERTPPARSVPAGAKATKTAGMCGVCHSEIRVKYEKGVHNREGIGCTSCHGGNAAAITVATAHTGGYRGLPARRTIPALCASCHADVAKMRFYNLPSDQYALYQTSQHGIHLAQGDANAAVCTDCHGPHEIRPPDDPQSSVFPRNIPNTCGKCHGTPSFQARYKKKENPVADYRTGVHGKAFLAGANDNAPECTRCHGSHGATPPGVGDVDKVCGQCHETTRGYFVAGPHKEAMDAAGLPECAACHHSHNTVAVKADKLTAVCADCHEKGDDEMKVAAAIERMTHDATAEIAEAERLVTEAARIPLYVEDYRSRLQDARTALLEAAPVTHALDTTLVEPHMRRARSIAATVGEEVHEKLSSRWWHKVGLGLFWFYLLLTAVILTRYRRRAAERDR
ncbi:MAG TPA: cytochrome c3 family protein [Candidatus Eisenbacteria bacterium]|nr:cytochrome c3 family protein [Candidatus Eisenbacteria bacterium]